MSTPHNQKASNGHVEDSTNYPINSTLNPTSINTTPSVESTYDDEFYTQSHHRQVTSNVVITSSETNNNNNVASTSYNVNNHMDYLDIASSGTNNNDVARASYRNVMNDKMDFRHYAMSFASINDDNVASTSNNVSNYDAFMNSHYWSNYNNGASTSTHVSNHMDLYAIMSSPWMDNDGASTSNNVNNGKDLHAVMSSPWMDNNGASTSNNNVNNGKDLHSIMSSRWMDNNNGASTSNNVNNGKGHQPIMSSPWINDNNIGSTSNSTNNNNVNDEDDDDMDLTGSNGYPAGYRFVPKDGELIHYYLQRKIAKKKLPHGLMRDVNLYGTTPERLCAENPPVGDNEWYFFTSRTRKYPKGDRPSRSTGTGYWKATGADKYIFHPHDGNKQIGLKKTLVFYDGKARAGAKSNWIMHEYKLEKKSTRKRLNDNDMTLDDYVLCKIYSKVVRPAGGGNNKKVKAENEGNPQATPDQSPASLPQPEMVQEDAKLPPQNLPPTFNNNTTFNNNNPYLTRGVESGLMEDRQGLFRNAYNNGTLEAILNYVPPVLPPLYNIVSNEYQHDFSNPEPKRVRSSMDSKPVHPPQPAAENQFMRATEAETTTSGVEGHQPMPEPSDEHMNYICDDDVNFDFDDMEGFDDNNNAPSPKSD